ncbi:integrase [Burkholderia ubonensis]|uniref:Integrase n=1 Tax=Burkholderia ubonensis TaxID=101571 RepID=A0AAW3MVM6_9BURK|nr:phage integrase family protein [Burkholderia ubonensis]KVP96530.1 integrase [Burkholderia ubonensis]KVP97874.1 integrase [Burkholderia ubonensis]KVZ92571.1 integrase [Burkholderia ubonensis]
MAQHNNIAEPVREYTRTDFAALRFKLMRIEGPAILNLYSDDELEKRGISSPSELYAWLDELRDHLVERARLANPRVSEVLDDARRRGSWPKGVLDFIINAGEQDKAQPKLTDGISVWFRPIVFRTLANEGLHTLADLKQCIETRGSGWYRPIPRLGPGKARAFERWFEANQASLGSLVRLPEKVTTDLVVLTPDSTTPLVPLERMSRVVQSLDGSQGRNRNDAFCLISARNDLEAVQAYLYKFRGRDKTLRAYKKELERFLLWCVCKRRVALSSVLTEECEAYKDFLAKPDPEWTGPKIPRSRNSQRWRPFEGPLSPASQKYAVQVIRSFFEWLIRVRYLGGNPWVTVADPAVEEKELEMAIDKALPGQLWMALTAAGGLLDRACDRHEGSRLASASALQAKEAATPGAQYRLARAMIFLIGFTGIRREEAAGAVRDKLKPVREQSGQANSLWELAVLGKRKKWRTVFLPKRVVDALKAHWEDRGHDFDAPTNALALLSPVVVPNTPWAQDKHFVPNEAVATLTGNGFSPDGIYKVLKSALLRLAVDQDIALAPEERELLKRAAPHAFRHTFATQAAAKLMPIDVLQRLLGHASQQTTSIYVQAERARGIEEASKFFGS